MNNYKYFEKFVFRLPTFPVKATSDKIDSAAFMEAIYLASSDLYNEMVRNKITTFHQMSPKMRITALKYFNRMRYRATPFGAFSACGIGNIGIVSEIEYRRLDDFKFASRLDMDLLGRLLVMLNEIPEIKNAILFYPNSSLYSVYKRFRYVEHIYEKGKKNLSSQRLIRQMNWRQYWD